MLKKPSFMLGISSAKLKKPSFMLGISSAKLKKSSFMLGISSAELKKPCHIKKKQLHYHKTEKNYV